MTLTAIGVPPGLATFACLARNIEFSLQMPVHVEKLPLSWGHHARLRLWRSISHSTTTSSGTRARELAWRPPAAGDEACEALGRRWCA